jgi:purine-binding chemotaxis protein CheW
VTPTLRMDRVAVSSGDAERGASAPARSLLLFHLGDRGYALPLGAVQEIVPLALLSQPPRLPPLLAGFLNLGGQAVPVLRLDRLFGLPELSPGLYTPLLILRDPCGLIALLVGKASRVVTLAGEAVVPVRENGSFNDCVEGVVVVGGHSFLVLHPERLLLEKERQCLAELEAAELDRLRGWEEAGP